MTPPKNLPAAPPNKMSHRRGIGFARGLFALVVGILIAVLVALSLWVAIGAGIQKVKVSQGASQIIDIVGLARNQAAVDRGIGTVDRDDLVAHLAKFNKVQISDSSRDGLKNLVNPWGGTLVVYTVPDNQFRIETVVPSRSCVRMINLMTNTIASMGVRKIEVKGIDDTWRSIYEPRTQDKFLPDDIVVGCRTGEHVLLDFTVVLR